MKNKKLYFGGPCLFIFVVIFIISAPVLATDINTLKSIVKDEARICKNVAIENNIDAVTAFKMATTQNVPVIDVRTLQEYQYVGHIPSSYNIPFQTWGGKYDEKKKSFGLEQNSDFVKQFEKLFPDKNAPYILVCRSGHRSGKAIGLLSKAGYTKLYNVWEGFEGIIDSDKSSPNYGRKTVDGWKNRNLPYTWDIDPKLIVSK